jgi:hypothetical protein
MKTDFLKYSRENGLIFSARNPNARIRQEKFALSRIIYKRDYLSRYNIALRHMFIHVLGFGYDIPDKSVHRFFRDYSINILCIDPVAINGIIDARHHLKYGKRLPREIIYQELSGIINMIQPYGKPDSKVGKSNCIPESGP